MIEQSSCLVIAGEKSGEDHAMTFLPQLSKQLPHCKFYGVGGNLLQGIGVELKYHLKDFSGIGFSEVLTKIPFYYTALGKILKEVKRRKTKTAILIDFQGFNLKLAKELKKLNVNVLYYVAPQAWVWKPWRAKVLEKNVHTLFTILPFEKQWFRDRGVSKVRAVIHPLMIEHREKLKSVRVSTRAEIVKRRLRLLLLPGSRYIEVASLLSVFERAVKLIQESIDIELGIVKSDSVDSRLYRSDMFYDHQWSSSHLNEALEWADISIAASGTVTLATGLYQVPTVVCYKVSYFTEFILDLLVPYQGPISLTNIVAGKLLFPELIQHHADRYNIAKYVKSWYNEAGLYDELVTELDKISDNLTGDDFEVSDYMAKVIQDGR